ncbi:outer membrane autotransporter barrel domain-containing protein [Microbulbifer donghaiensis]|uniref:Outer membrane autotransporter barrel domain-containing protein n=1 Tax=Microbulbifer donghaiensis TaxID=494016 RepID=A0A1M4Z7B0_9GAMM|nr:autotransporter outer membrane beta-barrel domain-containing protein [Microbulbifer donghaiensis]SHF13486.1 outer membrane autotransporter barrel domain-containing protein [Microbulbifer donghaiensis]
MGKNIRTNNLSNIKALNSRVPRLLAHCATAALFTFTGPVLADCTPGNIGTEGPDQISCDENNDAGGADVDALGGDDTIDVNGGTVGSVFGGSGADTINIGGGGDDSSVDIDDAEEFDPGSLIGVTVTIENVIDAGSGDDTITLNNRLADVGNFSTGGGIDGGSGDDTIQLLDGLAFHVWGGDGNDTITLDGGFVFNYIDGGDGDDSIYWDEGLTDEVRGGNGSDSLTIDAFAFEGEAILDGGDDTSPVDGYIDTLTFVLDYAMDGRLLRNWERIVIWGSSKMVFSGALNVGGGLDGDGNDLGLDILFGGLVQFTPRHFVVTGNIANAGTLDLGNERYDSLTVARDAAGNFGDYIGHRGRLWLDARLNSDDSPADLFSIAGAASGRTFIRVANRGGTGARTSGDGIKLVEVGGNSPDGAFELDGDYVAKDAQPAVVAGAYAYTLHHNGRADPADGDWYLRSVVSNAEWLGAGEMPRWQPGAVMYETYPQLLRSLNIPPSLRSRVGNRFWMGSSYRDAERYDYATAEERIIDGGGPWMRSSVRRLKFDPQQSTTRASWDQDYFQLQLGVDTALNFTVRGTQPVAGVALLYGDSENDLESFFGNGNIDVKGYGVSGFMTWYGNGGEYLDAQLLLNWFESDITAFDLRDLAKGADAFGYAFSLEAGRSFRLHNLYSVTPQAQLIYSSEEADNIHDVYDVSVTDINNHGFLARFGATLEKRVSRRKSSRKMYGSLPLERFSFYATPSVIYNIDQETDVTVSGTRLYQDRDDWLGELSIGATYDECGDYCSIYGEIYYATSLENFGDSDGGGLVLGFRYKW